MKDVEFAKFLLFSTSNFKFKSMRFIALLRGINVSGQKIIKMEELRGFLSRLGYVDVTSYIQTGNIGFTHEAVSTSDLESVLENQLSQEFGYSVNVIVRSQVEIKQMISAKPFTDNELANKEIRCTLSFLKQLPSDFEVPQFIEKEQIRFTHKFGMDLASIAYPVKQGFTYPNQYLDGKLKLISTNRNWNTLVKLGSL